ncbi:MAG: xylulokinase [Candidatus Fimenecus sp.]
MRYVIGIDLGTSATKAVLFDETGVKIASASAEYPMVQPQNGWAEQDPEDWWNAAVTVIGEMLTKSGVSPAEIVSLGISGQMHGLVMLDENCQVIRPCILWCDQRTKKECEQLTEIVGREKLVQITANPALTGFTASKLLWVKNNEPQNFEKCRHILLPKDYLRYRLTGEFASEMSDASGTQLLDVPNRKWSKEMIEAVGVPMSAMPKLYESPEITGYISETAAKITGLSTKTAVVGGAGDNAAAAVGTGVVENGKAFTTIGTSGVVYVHTDKPKLDTQGRIHTFCCAVPGAWHVMGVTQGAGLSLQWFKNQFCNEEILKAKAENRSVYALLDETAESIPVGAENLFYLPYLMGERTPHLDPDCRGVFFGISAKHTRAHFIRAVMEGVSYSLYDCLCVIHETGINPNTMLLTGGGGSSAFWRQMLCDLFGLPVQTASSSEGAALGAAVLAAVGAGIYSDVSSACKTMVKYNPETQQPNAQRTAEYRHFHAFYDSLYGTLKDRFGALASL